jgi:beta-barrel assembly-enhancing protease
MVDRVGRSTWRIVVEPMGSRSGTRSRGPSGSVPRALRILGWLVCGLLAALVWAPDASPDQTFPPTSDEVKLGAKVAKDIESQYRVVTDPAQVERVARVGEALSRFVERQDLEYHFKILSVGVVNSFAIPGGWVYITEGMMRFIRSDDELAAVLAHELTHINHRHYYIQAARSRNMTPLLVLAAALSVLARSPAPLMGVGAGATGAMSSYQRDLEKDADLTGISYLTKTAYSPVGMLTLMEHLAQSERLSGMPDDLGIYQDHPRPADRVTYIYNDLSQRAIPIVRRTAEGCLKLSLAPQTPEGTRAVTIQVDGQPVLTLTATVDGQAPAERARAVMARLDAFFNRDPAPYDVRAVNVLDGWSIVGSETVLFDVTSSDAALLQVSPRELAEDVRARLAQVISAAPYNRKF